MFRQLAGRVSKGRQKSARDGNTHVRDLGELDGQNVSRSCHGCSGPFGLIHNNSLFAERGDEGVRETKGCNGAEVLRVVRGDGER